MTMRKSATLRRLEGNLGHRRIRPEVIGLGRPVPPARLTRDQLQQWHDIVGSLPAGYLTRADVQAIERLAVARDLYRQTCAAINRDGFLVRGQRHPLLAVRRMAVQEMNACGKSLGMPPASRARLTGQSEGEPDVLSQLMRPPRNN